jgi:hypothetical protein
MKPKRVTSNNVRITSHKDRIAVVFLILCLHDNGYTLTAVTNTTSSIRLSRINKTTTGTCPCHVTAKRNIHSTGSADCQFVPELASCIN